MDQPTVRDLAPERDHDRPVEDSERMRRRLDDVLSALDAGILLVGTEGRIEQANEAASALTGIDRNELVGRAVGEVVEPEGRASRPLHVARRALAGGSAGEVVLLRSRSLADTTSDRERLERIVDTMVTLADLSHKINNPLTSLLGRAQILRLRLETDPAMRKAADVVEESARRIAEHVRELANVVRDTRNELRRYLDSQS